MPNYIPTSNGMEGATVNSGDELFLGYNQSAFDTTVNSGGLVDVNGGTAIRTTVNDGGVQSAISGGTTSDTVVNNGGTETLIEGSTATGTIVNDGGFQIVDGYCTATDTTVNAGGFQVLSGNSTAIGTIVGSGGTEIVSSDFIGSPGAPIDTALHIGGVIDVTYLAYAAGASASVDASGVLTVSDGGSSYTQNLAGDYAGITFQVSADSAGQGINVTAEGSAPCYCRGTQVLTEHGYVAVEALRIGDGLVTRCGAVRPVRWIGQRSYAGAFIEGNPDRLPVCIKAGALDHGVPRRDLHVSPGHAMFIGGQLVPARRLINGVSIVEAAAVESVTYYHIELDCHAVILAEGAPAESFLDDACRRQFQNAAEYHRLYPDADPMAPLQPRLEDGFALRAIQDRLALRAGVIPTAEPIGALRGFVDFAGAERVCGWAQDIDSPEEPVVLEVLAAGVPVLCVLANAFRADLRRAGFGSGCHAFDMALPAEVTGDVVVRRLADGWLLLPTAAALVENSRRAA